MCVFLNCGVVVRCWIRIGETFLFCYSRLLLSNLIKGNGYFSIEMNIFHCFYMYILLFVYRIQDGIYGVMFHFFLCSDHSVKCIKLCECNRAKQSLWLSGDLNLNLPSPSDPRRPLHSWKWFRAVYKAFSFCLTDGGKVKV